MNLTGALAVLALMATGAASSVAAQDVPTDTELFAAYCFGQLQARKLIGEPWAKSTDALKTSGMERTRRYLYAKGYLSGSRSTTATEAISAATQYGRADAAECEGAKGWGESVFQACRTDCASSSYSKECGACYDRLGLPVCVRGWRCNDLSSLPL